jgi:hypothetical protein
MPTTLDPETQKLIDERNTLLRQQERGGSISDELHKINVKLDSLGLAYQSRDPDYDTYLRVLRDYRRESEKPYTPEELEEQHQFIRSFIEKLH